MYNEYFGFKEEPFNLTPDPKFLYLNEGNRETLARLKYGIEMRKGLIVLTGDIGTGKTTLLLSYTAEQPDNQQTAMILNPRIAGKNLLQYISRELGIDLDYRSVSKADTLNLLYEYVLKKSFFEHNFVIIIDDAHELEISQFEDILLLTKLETNTQKLVQVVLSGLPKLLDGMKTPELLPLFQRIQIQVHIKPLSYADTQNYIFHRLQQVGYTRKAIFKADAIQRIFQLSNGIPRIISIVASNALLYAYLHNLPRIDHKVVNFSSDKSLQEVADVKSISDREPVKSVFPAVPLATEEKKGGWLKWILILLLVLFSILGLNILAQYLIQTFQLF